MSRQSKPTGIKWLAKVEEHDYPAAQSYLLLLYDKKQVKKFITLLKAAEVSQFKSKDIFRASGLSLLGISNSHVEKDNKKIRDGKFLSPLLLVRDPHNGKVIIADGYHRLCAVYGFDEDTWIHCKIV
jgi:disulfide oxidoreductase YuzD